MKLVVIVCTFFLAFSCNTEKKQRYEIASKPAVKIEQTHPGKKLMKVHCYICHDATTAEDKRLAPPMEAVKRRYAMGSDTKEQFISNIKTFIKHPTKDNAIMFGAVSRFGVMSKMAYPESVIEKIGDYMYDNELEKPDWFEAHYQKNHGKQK